MQMATLKGCNRTALEDMRSISTSRRLWMTLASAALVLLWDVSGLDLDVMHWWGTSEGFALRNHPWLSQVLHTRGQQSAMVVFFVMWWVILRPFGPWRELSRRERLAIGLAVTTSVLSISMLKHFSLTSCPWDLRQFGGSADYVSHWAWGVSDLGRGKCFPGGHASSAFGFLAASMPFLFSPKAELKRHGMRLLAGVVLVGLVFGLTQTMRGAHYPSHTFWTAWICWTVGLVVYQLTATRQQTPTA